MDPEHQQPKAAKAVRSASEMAREERLKAALKANMARRKAQARAIFNASLGSGVRRCSNFRIGEPGRRQSGMEPGASPGCISLWG